MPLPVKVFRQAFPLPIFPLLPADPNPALPSEGYRAIYPYPRQYRFERHVKERIFQALVLENEYLQVQVLPELGGRVWQTCNKATGLPLFHTPAKVGLINFALRGAWYTGGVEFNFPNGHSVSANEVLPAMIRRESNGAASILVGNLDLVQRVAYQVGIYLEPGSSSLHFDIFLNNRTSMPVRFSWWLNAAVQADDQLEYVNDTTEVVSHFLGRQEHLGEAVSWPIYQGKDLRWYREYVEPTSLFHLAGDDRWFGFYNHAQDQGVVRLGSSADAPGLKFWVSGQAEEGYLWGTYMTAGERYANTELQSGRPETQTDYGVFPPHTTLRWRETWRPVWGLGGLDHASPTIALKLQRDGQSDLLRMLGNQPYPSCRVRVQATEMWEGTVEIPADRPSEVRLPFAVSDSALRIEVWDAQGRRLLDYARPQDQQRRSVLADILAFKSEPVKPPSKMTAEELCLQALQRERFQLFTAARRLAEQVLAHDSGHVHSHLLLARLDLRSGRYPQARQHCLAALQRDPWQDWAQYYLALSWLWEGNYPQALLEFERCAGRGFACQGAAWFHIGEQRLAKFGPQAALQAFDRCLEREAQHIKALVLKAASLRAAGYLEEARQVLAQVQRVAPLDPLVRAESWLEQATDRPAHPFAATTNQFEGDEVVDLRPAPALAQDAIEAACDYLAAGLANEAGQVLAAVLDASDERHPVAEYMLGYAAMLQGDETFAFTCWRRAADHSRHSIYAFRPEEALVLETVLQHFPQDGLAHALLGMFETARGNPERAIPHLQEAVRWRPGWDVPLRLLGLCFQACGDLQSAVTVYRQAVEVNPENAVLRVELDQLLASRPESDPERQQLWSDMPDSILEDEPARYRAALAYATAGSYGAALAMLTNHVFFPEEGSSKFRDLYCQIHLMKAMEARAAGQPGEAYEYALRASSYPEHLGLAQPYIHYDAAAYLLQALLLVEAGNKQDALQALNLAMSERHREVNEAEFFSGLACRYAGREASAARRFQRLLDKAQAALPWPDGDQQTLRFYELLARAGLGEWIFDIEYITKELPQMRWQALWIGCLLQALDEIQSAMEGGEQ